LLDKVKDTQMEETLAPLFAYWRDSRHPGEKFGDFTYRIGKEGLLAYMDAYTLTEKDLAADPETDVDSDSDVSVAPVVTQAELRAEMVKSDDIACEIDKLDYLQVIPECRDDEPTANGAKPPAAAPAAAPAAKPPADAKICEVSGFRMFKGNLPQWRVRWTADDTESWEIFDKIDSDTVRARALDIQAATK
jgi:hypothetical protein